jgi:cystine transport system substrate-binding protein
MKRRIFGLVAIAIILCPWSRVGADTLSDLAAESNRVSQETADFEAQMADTLAQVNTVYAQLEQVRTAYDKAQKDVAATQKKIAKTKKQLVARKAAMDQQMRELQVASEDDSILNLILSAKDIPDIISRTMRLRQFRRMQVEKFQSVEDMSVKLEKLEASQVKKEEQLASDAAAYQAEADAFSGKLATLKAEIAANQAQLDQLAQSKAAEEKRLADEKAAAEAAAKAEAEARAKEEAEAAAKAEAEAQAKAEAETAKASEETSTPSASASKESAAPTPAPVVPETPATSSGGRTLTVETTAYSSDGNDALAPGHITATGIDLWVNPMVIAVDPSVIPLGSIVEVPGYGVAIAGDTGGAIRGNKIDVHFPTTAQCIQWGRRSVTIKILE